MDGEEGLLWLIIFGVFIIGLCMGFSIGGS